MYGPSQKLDGFRDYTIASGLGRENMLQLRGSSRSCHDSVAATLLNRTRNPSIFSTKTVFVLTRPSHVLTVILRSNELGRVTTSFKRVRACQNWCNETASLMSCAAVGKWCHRRNKNSIEMTATINLG
ncbi:hypothetical protein Y032_0024g950 [Ancylostoma ceylanicum]|uniref:Uncharacterized protein n=1 Tax=Ancylostoma ceylanicum TaxID=53326 RepID=A0A016UW09_9BILA|nr:hypothetical protein Y032_0024g950 [Ancylostoma ceylanicum]